MKNKIKTGHKEIISETIAKIRFFKEGINAYSRFLDTQRIDFIVRVDKPGGKVDYKEIQVKYCRAYKISRKKYKMVHGWTTIDKNKLRIAPNFYYVVIVGLDDPNFFIFPSKEFVELLKKYVRFSKTKKNKIIYNLDIDRYAPNKHGILKKRELRKAKQRNDLGNYVDITDSYFERFDLLKS